MPCRVALHQAMPPPCHAAPCCPMPCQWHAPPRHAMLCHAMLYHAMPCCTMPCQSSLCAALHRNCSLPPILPVRFGDDNFNVCGPSDAGFHLGVPIQQGHTYFIAVVRFRLTLWHAKAKRMGSMGTPTLLRWADHSPMPGSLVWEAVGGCPAGSCLRQEVRAKMACARTDRTAHAHSTASLHLPGQFCRQPQTLPLSTLPLPLHRPLTIRCSSPTSA